MRFHWGFAVIDGVSACLSLSPVVFGGLSPQPRKNIFYQNECLTLLCVFVWVFWFRFFLEEKQLGGQDCGQGFRAETCCQRLVLMWFSRAC